MFSYCGHPIRVTDAIPERHLMVDGGQLWLGRSELWTNVLRAVAAGHGESSTRLGVKLAELMHTSHRTRRSVDWNSK